MNTLMLKFPALHQVIRYGVVGVLNNLFGYLIYLLVTFIWLDPKVAITIFYPLGAITAYFGHSKYSFARHVGNRVNTTIRFSLAYFVGYGVNFLMLLILADKLKYPHQLVQVVAIFVVAGFLFLMLKYFVFPSSLGHKT